MDVFSKKKRSEVMSKIRSRDTKPELIVRSWLHKQGFRFRLHDRSLPGTPDIVLKKYKTVIFVHGCFWHQHKGCRYASVPKTRRAFWRRKLAGNVARDRRNLRALAKMGWRVLVTWECEANRLKSRHIVSENGGLTVTGADSETSLKNGRPGNTNPLVLSVT